MDAILALACASAAVSGGSLAAALAQAREVASRQRSMRDAVESRSAPTFVPECGGAAARVLALVQRESRTAPAPRLRRLLDSRLLGLGMKDARTLIARAGLSETATPEGLRSTRLKALPAGAAAGAAAGIVLSPELALLLGTAGMAVGFACVPWALKREAAARNADMERHLSEMIEVVVLGLQSGLSFERSFALYPRYFDTGLARAMTRAAGQWEMGLATREEALRRLEAQYDSPLLSRVIGSMVRSLRFGTSVAESLEAAAVEAREAHRARMEEKVAKVAVKMMLPVGTLILPAMLLLVLGPVLLELAEGF